MNNIMRNIEKTNEPVFIGIRDKINKCHKGWVAYEEIMQIWDSVAQNAGNDARIIGEIIISSYQK